MVVVLGMRLRGSDELLTAYPGREHFNGVGSRAGMARRVSWRAQEDRGFRGGHEGKKRPGRCVWMRRVRCAWLGVQARSG